MRAAFEKVAKAYEGAKESVKNKWENFKKKFEGTKSEMSQEVMKAESPEELIALGKKLQQQGEALQAEEGGIRQEETQKGKMEAQKSEMIESAHGEALEENVTRDKEKMDKAHGEALKENKAFDEAKAAKAAEEEAKRKAELAEQDRLQAEEDAKKAADILERIKGAGSEDVAGKDQEEQAENQENIVYERLKVATLYDKDGTIKGMYPALRNNAKFMLEAFKINPANTGQWASRQLMGDPKFLDQLKVAYKEKYPNKDADKYISSINESRYDVVDQKSEDVSDDLVEWAKKKAVEYNKTSGWEQADSAK